MDLPISFSLCAVMDLPIYKKWVVLDLSISFLWVVMDLSISFLWVVMDLSISFSLCVVMDSNHRRQEPADLQSAPFGHSGNYPLLESECKINTFS